MFCFIKAINPLLTMMVNLPCLKGSCPNFLRPTCPYTECLPSFLTGSCPTERTTASYSSCFYFDFTDLLFPQETVIPWTLPLCLNLLVIVLMQYLSYSIVIGLLSRTLPDLRSIWNPAEFWTNQFYCLILCYAAIASCFSGRLMSINIFFGS